jgi:hypothetical protein
MIWVASLILVTRRGGRQGIWCEACRCKQALVWSSVSGLLGWWGFPFGPIYTIPALYHNAKGGKQDTAQNAALLRLVSFQLYEKGNLLEALAAISSSVALEKDRASVDFADSIRSAVRVPPRKRRFPRYQLLTAAPSAIAILLIFAAILLYTDQPSGYESRFHGTPNTSAAVIPPRSEPQSGRARVNGFVDELAEAVTAHATPAGSHQEGTTTINDYELDRSRYQPTPFDQVAAEIDPFLGDRQANSDGFASSAYFNAKLMGLSVAVMNDFDNGVDISNEVEEINSLGTDERIEPWLSASKYGAAFTQLKSQLALMKRRQTLGFSHAAREARLHQLSDEIDSSKARILQARSVQDPESEQAWIDTHNRDVELYNSLLTTHKRSYVAQSKADLAFNRCFDPAILMSKYQQVNLMRASEKVDALPNE